MKSKWLIYPSILVTVLIMFSQLPLNAQSKDDYAEEISRLATLEGANRIKALHSLARKLRLFYERDALTYAEEAAEFAIQFDDKQLLAESELVLSIGLTGVEDYGDAIVHSQKAEGLYRNLGNMDRALECMVNSAMIYNYHAKLTEADAIIQKAKEEFPNSRNAWLYGVSAANKARMKNREDSLAALTKAVEYCDDEIEEANIRLLVGITYTFNPEFRDPASENLLLSEELFRKNNLELSARWSAFREMSSSAYSDQTLSIAEQLRDFVRYFREKAAQKNLALALTFTGDAFKNAGVVDQALQYYIEADELLHALEFNRPRMYNLNSLARLFSSTGDYEKAVEMFEESIALAENLDDQHHLAFMHYNLALTHVRKEKYTAARPHIDAALVASTAAGLSTVHNAALNLLSAIQSSEEDYEGALHTLLQIAENYEKENALFTSKRLNQLNLAKVYAQLGDRSKALSHLKNVESLQVEAGNEHGHKVWVLAAKTDIYELLGDYKAAFTSMQDYYEEKKSIDALKSQERIDQLKIQFETTEKEREIELLNEREKIKDLELARQTLITIGIGVGLLLIAFLATAIFVAYRIKANALKREEELSRKDPLTQLMNRRAMNEQIKDETDRFLRSKLPFSLVIADIDFFKEFNDTYGHECGDEVLKTVSNIFENSVRRQDKVARWGGEEFLILLPETATEGAAKLADKIRRAIEASSLEYDSKSLKVTMSFGICQFSSQMSIDQCLNKADEALYVAKENGRNRLEMAQLD